jgi:hypothetical protein
MALRAPTNLRGTVIQVPVLDSDGNATGGIRLPDIVAPLGTHAAQNPPLSLVCSLAAGDVEFTKIKEARDSANDSRLSLAEPYKSRNDYTNRIRGCGSGTGAAGLLLAEDAASITCSAAESKVAT